jgi:hypothetical protein
MINNNHANHLNYISDKGTFSFPCPVRDNVFVEKNMNNVIAPSRMGGNVISARTATNNDMSKKHKIQRQRFIGAECKPTTADGIVVLDRYKL